MLPPQSTPTALLVIDLQLGLTHPTAHGPPRNNPNLESNITTLLSSARAFNTSNPKTPITTIHIHHHSTDPTSLLHPTHIIDWSNPSSSSAQSTNGQRGIDPMPCAIPLADEPVLTKRVNSAFIGTDLEDRLRKLGVKQVFICGMTTEHCVSSTTRMCANLDVCGYGDGDGQGVVLVEDGCACFGKVVKKKGEVQGKEILDAEVVHAVEIECLRWEFAEVVEVVEVVKLLEGEGGVE